MVGKLYKQPKRRPFTMSTMGTNRIVPWVNAVCGRCAFAGPKVSIDVGLAGGWFHVALASITGASPPPGTELSIHSTTPGVVALTSWTVELGLTLHV